MEGNSTNPEPNHAIIYVDADGTVTHGVPEDCQVKRSPNFTHKRIGVCVLIYDPERGYVFGKRKGSHGAGKWATPGGHTELEETLEQCVHREVMEETGLKVGEAKFLGFTYDNFIESNGSKASLKNYLTTWWVTRAKPGDNPVNVEVNKCEGWGWKTFEDLLEIHETEDEDLFLPVEHLFDTMPNWHDEVVIKYADLNEQD